jgi:hypothetical protein
MTDKCEYCGQETRYGHNSICVMNEVTDLRIENERLRAEKAEMRSTVADWIRMHAENERLRAALIESALASVIFERIVGLDLTNVERARVAAYDAARGIAIRASEQETR